MKPKIYTFTEKIMTDDNVFEICEANRTFQLAMFAIDREDIKSLYYYISAYPKILEMTTFFTDDTLLHYAADKSVKAFCFLAPRMPEALKQKDVFGQVPAHFAPNGVFLCGSISALKLIEQMAPETLTIKDAYGRTPAHLATKYLKSRSVSYRKGFNYIALKHTETLTIKDKNGETPLDLAQKAGVDISRFVSKAQKDSTSKEMGL